ncbi:MAG: hypothetical protein CL581_11780 [Alteromonadaceae bacterium]|nr:hypothetical protein [Alteromonadaceae bacterium]MBH86866.1 hypothetical protein [Alteromonadaceae bacterium]|tara:strand:+ start:1221 stop:1535 length:315 start_codon:yes stop_codon:yes gene_type:complete
MTPYKLVEALKIMPFRNLFKLIIHNQSIGTVYALFGGAIGTDLKDAFRRQAELACAISIQLTEHPKTWPLFLLTQALYGYAKPYIKARNRGIQHDLPGSWSSVT